MRVLLIDDVRDEAVIQLTYGEKPTYVARTYEAGIEALKNGPWDLLYLDHDLGTDYLDDNGYPSTGYGIMCFIEANPHLKPSKIVIVSSNPVGRMRMQVVIDKLYASTG